MSLQGLRNPFCPDTSQFPALQSEQSRPHSLPASERITNHVMDPRQKKLLTFVTQPPYMQLTLNPSHKGTVILCRL